MGLVRGVRCTVGNAVILLAPEKSHFGFKSKHFINISVIIKNGSPQEQIRTPYLSPYLGRPGRAPRQSVGSSASLLILFPCVARNEEMTRKMAVKSLTNHLFFTPTDDLRRRDRKQCFPRSFAVLRVACVWMRNHP